MEKHLFLQGPLYGEYSNFISVELSGKLAYAGGYIVKTDDLAPRNICIFPAYTGAGFPAAEKYCCLSFGEVIQRDNDAYRNGARKLIEEAYNYPYCVLSPFGGYEIVIPQYREALDDLLSSDLPVIGYLINESDALAYRTMFGLGDHYADKIRSFEQQILKYENTEILHIDDLSRAELTSSVRAWESQYAQY